MRGRGACARGRAALEAKQAFPRQRVRFGFMSVSADVVWPGFVEAGRCLRMSRVWLVHSRHIVWVQYECFGGGGQTRGNGTASSAVSFP
eukprot:1493936-Pleurochrysis_carterae.AAC.2